MKICVAQTRAVKGDIQENIINHKKWIELAISQGAEMIIFPELSLTGYEPTLAEALSTQQEDRRFDEFQQISDAHYMTIGVGMPVKNETGICISMLLFQPNQPRTIYSKKYIHADEEPFFVSGENKKHGIGKNMALAICYEISVPAHAEDAFKSGAKIYLASVAKSISGIDKATDRLAEIARTYSMTVLMSNCIGLADGEECAGKSSIWNTKGQIIGQLNDTHEGILILDTDTQEVVEKMILAGGKII
jgi:predicted amidohydrolase